MLWQIRVSTWVDLTEGQLELRSQQELMEQLMHLPVQQQTCFGQMVFSKLSKPDLMRWTEQERCL
jgi:hypothetical protein